MTSYSLVARPGEYDLDPDSDDGNDEKVQYNVAADGNVSAGTDTSSVSADDGEDIDYDLPAADDERRPPPPTGSGLKQRGADETTPMRGGQPKTNLATERRRQHAQKRIETREEKARREQREQAARAASAKRAEGPPRVAQLSKRKQEHVAAVTARAAQKEKSEFRSEEEMEAWRKHLTNPAPVDANGKVLGDRLFHSAHGMKARHEQERTHFAAAAKERELKECKFHPQIDPQSKAVAKRDADVFTELMKDVQQRRLKADEHSSRKYAESANGATFAPKINDRSAAMAAATREAGVPTVERLHHEASERALRQVAMRILATQFQTGPPAPLISAAVTGTTTSTGADVPAPKALDAQKAEELAQRLCGWKEQKEAFLELLRDELNRPGTVHDHVRITDEGQLVDRLLHPPPPRQRRSRSTNQRAGARDDSPLAISPMRDDDLLLDDVDGRMAITAGAENNDDGRRQQLVAAQLLAPTDSKRQDDFAGRSRRQRYRRCFEWIDAAGIGTISQTSLGRLLEGGSAPDTLRNGGPAMLAALRRYFKDPDAPISFDEFFMALSAYERYYGPQAWGRQAGGDDGGAHQEELQHHPKLSEETKRIVACRQHGEQVFEHLHRALTTAAKSRRMASPPAATLDRHDSATSQTKRAASATRRSGSTVPLRSASAPRSDAVQPPAARIRIDPESDIVDAIQAVLQSVRRNDTSHDLPPSQHLSPGDSHHHRRQHHRDEMPSEERKARLPLSHVPLTNNEDAANRKGGQPQQLTALSSSESRHATVRWQSRSDDEGAAADPYRPPATLLEALYPTRPRGAPAPNSVSSDVFLGGATAGTLPVTMRHPSPHKRLDSLGQAFMRQRQEEVARVARNVELKSERLTSTSSSRYR